MNFTADFIAHLQTQIFPAYFNQCRWFAGKALTQKGFEIQRIIPFGDSVILIVAVHYTDHETERYQLPLSKISIDVEVPAKGILEKTTNTQLIDAIYDERFRQQLYEGIYTQSVELPSLSFRRGNGLADTDTPTQIRSRVLPVDSSNSAMIFGDKYFMKLYRKLFDQTNPEVEMVSFLTQHGNFQHIPAYVGSIAWQSHTETPEITLGMMQQAVSANKDNWGLTGDYLNDFMYGIPQAMFAIHENVFEQVALLGKRTGEMHLSLYAPKADAAFSPESFDLTYRQFLIHRLTHLLNQRYDLLIENYVKLDVPTQRLAWIFMEARELIEDFAQDMITRPIESKRIRIHGDYHLGQVLTANNDFVIIDFEGEPEATIADRKIKHSPLKDVAGMIRSYHYAVSAKLFESTETKDISPEKLQLVSDRWYKLMQQTYLDAYLEVFGLPHPLFSHQHEINFLLLFFLLEKAVYELGYEISYRPTWVKIPLRGIVEVIREIEKIKEPSVRISRLGIGT